MGSVSSREEDSIGALLRFWRTTRRLSQLALATEAQISARHLCFIETGRAKPSREMVVLLTNVLDVPLRERNALLLAAGFAPTYAESALDASALSSVRAALDAMLRQQEPFPAVVMNRYWDVLDANAAATRFFRFLLGGRPLPLKPNVVRMMFDGDGLRPHVTNWPDVAEALIGRLRRESIGGLQDDTTRALLSEVLGYPGVPARPRSTAPAPANVPIVPVRFAKNGFEFNFFSTVTTLGTPQDITAQEVRLECFFPLDQATVERARQLADYTGDRSDGS
jgi:transcriptional regulator with XRE-family HTH domain